MSPEAKRLLTIMKDAMREAKKIGAGNPGYSKVLRRHVSAWLKFHHLPGDQK